MHLGQVGNHALDTVHVALAGSDVETGKGHDSSGNIHSPERDGPLESTNEGLVVSDPIFTQFLGHVQFWVISLLEG